jgi:hypothetical protein
MPSLARRPGSPAALAVLATAVALCGRTSAQEPPLNIDRSGHTEKTGESPPRTAARIVDAGQARVADAEIVIGVVVDGRPRAYPINLMWGPDNEVVNDTLGRTAIAASWCPIVLSGEVYSRTHAGEKLALGAAGAEDGVLVLYDASTHSQWSQVSGRAVAGPLAGARLEKLPSLLTTWRRWKELHPDTTVYEDASPRIQRPRFTEESVGRVALSADGPVRNDDWVIGLEGRTSRAAFLVRRLAEPRLANEVFEDRPIVAFLTEDFTTAAVWERTVDGRVLRFEAEGDRLRDVETGTLWDPMTGRAVGGPLAGRALAVVPSSRALWYAWKAQYPDTRVYGEAPR